MTKTGKVVSCAIMFIKFLTLLVLSGLQVFKRNQKADRKKNTHIIENIISTSTIIIIIIIITIIIIIIIIIIIRFLLRI